MELSMETMMVLAGVVGSALMFVLRLVFKDKSDRAASNFTLGLRLVHEVLKEVAPRTQNTLDDKIEMGVRLLREFMEADGHSLSPGNEAQARMLFKAMHGEAVK